VLAPSLLINATGLFERMYDALMGADDDITRVQIINGSDAGAIPCRLNDQQRRGQACLVCGKRERLEETRARVGYVDGKPVFIHSYCSGAWQNAAVRVR
jgi:hypothetical protein